MEAAAKSLWLQESNASGLAALCAHWGEDDEALLFDLFPSGGDVKLEITGTTVRLPVITSRRRAPVVRSCPRRAGKSGGTLRTRSESDVIKRKSEQYEYKSTQEANWLV